MRKIFLLFLLLVLFIPIVSATISVTPIVITNNSIEWSFPTTVTSLSVDGILVTNYDTNSGIYQLNNLIPNTSHQISVHSLTDNGTSLVWTLAAQKTNQDIFFGILIQFLIIMIICVFCFIGLYVDFVGLIGSVIALEQLVINLSIGSFIIDVLYFILIIVGLMSCASVFNWS